MKAKRFLGLLLAASMTAGLLAGCGNDAGDQQSGSADGGGNSQQSEGQDGNGGSADNGGEEVNTTPFYMTLDPQVSGEIDIMTWSGDSVYHADMGHWDADEKEDLTSGNVAMIYAMAKKFNEMYPNVKINLYAKTGDGNGNDTSWDQEMENFKAEHGKYPDIYCSMALPQEDRKSVV